MKDKILGNIVAGAYLFLLISYEGLKVNKIIKDYFEDKNSVAKVDVFKGNGLDYAYKYVAFDKSGDGKIDMIKEYRSGISGGGRAVMPLSYSTRNHKGEKYFEIIKNEYFKKYK